MADEEVISDTERLRIAQHFLSQSPPGQFSEVLNDLKQLLPTGLLSDKLVAEVLKTYHSSNGKIVSDGNNKVLLHKHGEVGDTHYIDPASKRIVGVNHAEGAVDPASVRELGGEMDGSLEAERAELEKGVTDYVSSQYVTENATSAVYASAGSVFVVIYGERLNLRNYWSGAWLSVWQVDTTNGNTLSGSVKVRAHYFEEGNVQLQTTKAMTPTALPAEKSWTDAALSAIKTFEQDLHAGLGNMYTNMGDETFKAMRRKMLLSRQKFEWNINAHRVAKTLGAGAGK